jgi:hypothetical protein
VCDGSSGRNTVIRCELQYSEEEHIETRVKESHLSNMGEGERVARGQVRDGRVKAAIRSYLLKQTALQAVLRGRIFCAVNVRFCLLKQTALGSE